MISKWINEGITPPPRHMVGLSLVPKVLHSIRYMKEDIKGSSTALLDAERVTVTGGLVQCEDFMPSP